MIQKVNQLCGLIGISLIYDCYDIIGFVEVPKSQTVSLNDQAIFRCRHTSVDHDILWRVDGTVVNQQAPPELDPGFTRDEDGAIIDTLTITATRDYNNSEVVCVAKLDSQLVPTFPATLRGR